MTKEHIHKRVKRIIDQICYITISSVTPDGDPWNSPVFSAYDADYNFYWGSYAGSQHSKNVAANPKVFLVIYDSTVPSGEGQGVYMQAEVSQVESRNTESVASLLREKHLPADFWEPEALMNEGPIRLYKALPTKMWVNGEGEASGYYIDVRKEIDLEFLKLM